MKANWAEQWAAHPFKFGDKPEDGITCDVHDRVEQVRASTDTAWLERVIRCRDLQTTVRLAAERRLRRLLRKNYKG